MNTSPVCSSKPQVGIRREGGRKAAAATPNGPEALAVRGKTLRIRPEPVAPFLFRQAYETYAPRRANFPLSLLAHGIALALLLGSGLWVTRGQVLRALIPSLLASREYIPVAATSIPAPHGGGGGGDGAKVTTAEGRLPNLAMQQITSPEVVVRNDHLKLPAESTVIVP